MKVKPNIYLFSFSFPFFLVFSPKKNKKLDVGGNTQDRASPPVVCTNVHLPDEDISYNVPLFINEMLIVSSIVRKILYTLFSKVEILKI